MNRIATLAKLNRFDEALVVLEDAVELLERLMTATLPLTLRSTSPYFSEITFQVEEDCDAPYPDTDKERFLWLICENSRAAVFPTAWYNTFMNHDGWTAELCEDPRYIAITDRVKALIVTKE